MTEPRGRWRALALLTITLVRSMSTWFSASAVFAFLAIGPAFRVWGANAAAEVTTRSEADRWRDRIVIQTNGG